MEKDKLIQAIMALLKRTDEPRLKIIYTYVLHCIK